MQHNATTLHPVLLLTHDADLWQHWRGINDRRLLPARGGSLQDLRRWQDQGRELVLLDNGLPTLPSWDDAAWASYTRGMKVVVASSNPTDDEASKALAAGCCGYLHAYSPVEVLTRALETVQHGGLWMGRSLVARLLREVNRRLPRKQEWADGLTRREREVAELAALGDSNQAISDALGISERTVRAHLSAVFEKLGVQDRLLLALRVHGIS